jgi:hypothetical protein
VLPATPTADGRHVLARGQTASGAAVISVVDMATGNDVRAIPLADVAEGVRGFPLLDDMGLTPDGRTVVGLVLVRLAVDGTTGMACARWDVATGKYLGRVLVPGSVGSRPLSPDRRFATTARTPYDATLVEVTTGATWPLRYDGHNLVGMRLPVVSPDGRLAASPTRQDRTEPKGDAVTIWDVATGERVDRLPVTAGLVRFTPDGRGLLVADMAGVGLWDLATRRRVVWHTAHTTVAGDAARTVVTCWDVTPNGRTLATGHVDGTILLWDLTPAEPPAPASPLAPTDLDRFWADLGGADAAKAYRAGWELAARPTQSVAFIGTMVKPAAPADRDEVAKLVARLDAPAFADREAAEKALRALGPSAAPAMRAVLTSGTPSPEQRTRIDRVLRGLPVTGRPAADELPGLRAVAVLEWAGTREARKLLGQLAAGADDDRLTREAKAAVSRLGNE